MFAESVDASRRQQGCELNVLLAEKHAADARIPNFYVCTLAHNAKHKNASRIDARFNKKRLAGLNIRITIYENVWRIAAKTCNAQKSHNRRRSLACHQRRF